MRSIIQRDKRCYECGVTNAPLEVHHCIHGNKRKQADRDGLTVYLCSLCHKRLHSIDGALDRKYKRLAQRVYMETNKASIEKFISIYHRNYLEE